VKEALQGARDIVAELIAEAPAVRAAARERFLRDSVLVVTKARR
jgi:transcriptional accessory protein Tex/SPT6